MILLYFKGVIFIPKTKEYKEIIEDFKINNCRLISGKYTNSKEPLEYIASCGHNEKMSYHRFMSRVKQGITLCHKCGNIIKGTKSKYEITRLQNIFKERGCRLLSDKYKNIESQVDFIASCGHKSKITLAYFIKNTKVNLCKKCSKSKEVAARIYPYDNVVEIFSKNGAELLTQINDYHGVKTNVKYKCSCGRIKTTQVSHWLEGATHCNECKKPKGDKHHMWNPLKTNKMRLAKRQYAEYGIWRRNVFKRDKYTCQCCGVRNTYIQAHHILNYSEHYNLQHDITNGITLCRKCHNEFHKIYTRQQNNKHQIEEFIHTKLVTTTKGHPKGMVV